MKFKQVFYPQLDSLRAVAVILVIIAHWLGDQHIVNRYLPNGILGVTLFFVLSGFLITGILLRSKQIVNFGGSLRQAYRVFYIRRSLRIFPIYYVLLIVMVVLGVANIRDNFWWHFFYCSNFLFWLTGKFAGQLSHLWSLAVEEQFYLIWPSVIFFVPLKRLQGVFIGGIITAVVFRLVITTQANDMGRLLMPGSLDSFCVGGLLAYGVALKPKWYQAFASHRGLFVGISFILFVLGNIAFSKLSHIIFTGFYFLFVSIIFMIWIERVVAGVNRGPFKYILNNKALLYIGKISYGVYLFHNFIPYIYGIKFPTFLVPYSFYITQVIRFAMLMGISSLSWYLIEKPILKLKHYFEYSAERQAVVQPSVSQ